ncbi:DDE-type integrase/transposase/recombinase [Enterococcus faecium]|uniref:DDE-type integrase/transposase/recombinase n=1 Tax=Enterococcus TaxID=1350 RepID=UPI0009AE8D68|nr:DDE-type integrase/transposase/recombinase [Enterococcus faecalis]EKC6624173.1 DDE-type integrase/transposase/recombinase [Enterococcus faecium]EKC6654056.1 DDE-type integrase/transposase/recombinase [Enterococcus faecium]EKC6666014.1 DDE-type integrase/transposase/recombinase [Enterococcus faecium]EKC6683047.1 DDE-type integrase/transposase/recombinase [Enterococcus faecium]EKC6694892.1 DDE-type integrase/transposase/recombinase [Enterococcus faecium]
MPTVIHSDRGSQHRSFIYQELLTDHHITHSVSQTGTPVDNAVIEAFHRSIK